MIPMRALSLRERALCLFFPARCLGCGKAVLPEYLFCEECASSLPGQPFSRELPLAQAPGGFLPVLASLSYGEGFRKTLHRFKFREEWGLSTALGQMMGETARSFSKDFSLVTCVPMSAQKLRRRGYNQSALLGKAVAKELGLPFRYALEQARETDTQHRLTRPQRADNVRDAYSGKAIASGKDILLVDDIVTTGATLLSCARALYQAGAKSVCGLCAASDLLRQDHDEE